MVKLKAVFVTQAFVVIVYWLALWNYGSPPKQRGGSVEFKKQLRVGSKEQDMRFISFEPWNGGWNNRRMSFELALMIAIAQNRTLVLPPISRVALLPSTSGFEDFFNITRMRSVVPVLTWEEFKPVMGMFEGKGNVIPACSTLYRMPNPKTFCEKSRVIREKAHLVKWNTLQLVIPLPTDPSGDLESDMKVFTHGGRRSIGSEFRDLAKEQFIHFPQNLFGHFYQMFYIPDKVLRKRYYTAVRDATSMRDDVKDMARKIIDKLGGPKAYSCAHIRRRDFKQQYTSTFLEPTKLANNIRAQLTAKVFVASDEKDPDFWRVLKQGLPNVEKLIRESDMSSDFDAVPDVYKGVVVQLICSKASVFVGTRYSTFSSYVTRLRGYDGDIDNKEVYFADQAYEEKHPRFPPDKPYSWVKWKRAPWAREFAEAWVDLDAAPSWY